MSFKTPSYSSPKGGGIRACLCPNGTYSKKCCDGSLQAQGIGSIVRNVDIPTTLIPYFWGVSDTLLTTAEIVTLIRTENCNVVNQYANSDLQIVWNANGKFLWFAIQDVYPNKTKWFNTTLNQGNIGGASNLFNDAAIGNVVTPLYDASFKIYKSNYATKTSGSMILS
jgi:hypothetical protein